MKRIHHTMRWLFTAPQEPLTTRRIIGWWELRRIPFNVIFGIVGLLALLLFTTCIESAGVIQPGEDAVEPVALVRPPCWPTPPTPAAGSSMCPCASRAPLSDPASPRASFASGTSFHSSSSPFPPPSGAATASCSCCICCGDSSRSQRLYASKLHGFKDGLIR